MTMLDFHSYPLARDLCILFLLKELVEAKQPNPVVEAEILSTVFYALMGTVMPGHCHER